MHLEEPETYVFQQRSLEAHGTEMSKTMCQLLKTFRSKREENEHDQAANENMVHGEI